MFDHSTVPFSNSPRIGFACKVSHIVKDTVKTVDDCNFKTTTVAWMKRQSEQSQRTKLLDLVSHNLSALTNMLRYVSKLPQLNRMVRVGSDLLPLYTHPEFNHYYNDSHINTLIETHLARCRDIAQASDIRLSMHPDQFVCLGSDNPLTVENSVRDLAYHTYIMERLVGDGKNRGKINIHLSGSGGKDMFVSAFLNHNIDTRYLTIENDEFSSGLVDCIQASDDIYDLTGNRVPIVMDIHHHWVYSHGEYITPTDQRVERVIETWNGIRPTMHYSVSRETYLTSHCVDTLPDFKALLASGLKRTDLRGHSDYFWNNAANQWALSFLDKFDIMCESKAKNLASLELSKLVC